MYYNPNKMGEIYIARGSIRWDLAYFARMFLRFINVDITNIFLPEFGLGGGKCGLLWALPTVPV
jgi:hypothetical protein